MPAKDSRVLEVSKFPRISRVFKILDIYNTFCSFREIIFQI